MFVFSRSKNRPFHLGPFPLESLPRDDAVVEAESSRPPRPQPVRTPEKGLLADAVERYREIYARFVDGDPAPARAPVPDDPGRRAVAAKGAA